MRLSAGYGADVSIDCLGDQEGSSTAGARKCEKALRPHTKKGQKSRRPRQSSRPDNDVVSLSRHAFDCVTNSYLEGGIPITEPRSKSSQGMWPRRRSRWLKRVLTHEFQYRSAVELEFAVPDAADVFEVC